jgi:Lon protease-like protein
MTTFDPAPFVPSEFSGVARLFPLPNLVVFPHTLQPLHIFEPRYRKLLAAALATDRLIAMALLKPDDELSFDGGSEIESTVCLCKVICATQLPDGRSNILLTGVRRARIVEELDSGKAFREAFVELIDDVYPEDEVDVDLLQSELIGVLEDWLPDLLRDDEQFRMIFQGGLTLGAMSDIIAKCLPLDVMTKQLLLEESDVEQRGLLLIEAIEELDADDDEPMLDEENVFPAFPPRFSDN